MAYQGLSWGPDWKVERILNKLVIHGLRGNVIISMTSITAPALGRIGREALHCKEAIAASGSAGVASVAGSIRI
jgi:hypothetical protein